MCQSIQKELQFTSHTIPFPDQPLPSLVNLTFAPTIFEEEVIPIECLILDSKNIENILISMIFIILNMCVVFAILIVLNIFLLTFDDVFSYFFM